MQQEVRRGVEVEQAMKLTLRFDYDSVSWELWATEADGRLRLLRRAETRGHGMELAEDYGRFNWEKAGPDEWIGLTSSTSAGTPAPR